jgi:hypothetical protein
MKQLDVDKGNFNSEFESPFIEKNGLLEFKEDFTNPEFFAQWSFRTQLYGEPVVVDHCVITLPDRPSIESYAESFLPMGSQIVEGPDLFPIEFCNNATTVPADLWLHLVTVLMPSGGLLVLGSPHAAGDQLDRFVHERGFSAVHHVAIRVEDMNTAARFWEKKGFEPLSEHPLDYGSLAQWFLQNSAGQIIELINRHIDNNATFDCQNIAGLRLSEIAQ